MTHAAASTTHGAWVPRVGTLDSLPPERSALIRGLFELAAWISDHPDMPLPSVVATVDTGLSRWDWQCRVVDRVATALGVDAGPYKTATGTRYVAETAFGPVGLRACAISEYERASLAAAHSYIGAVEPVSITTSSTRGGA